ncbi:MAG TPA: hypothetical protein EYN67_03920 [Flavobacteriales bacterium]|nr:hypothetical protein [Flavobacteriales bacterium]
MTYHLKKRYHGGRTQWILPMGVVIQCTIDNGFLVCSTDDVNVYTFVTRRLKFKEYTPVRPTTAVKKTPPRTMVKATPTATPSQATIKAAAKKVANKKLSTKSSYTKKSHSNR